MFWQRMWSALCPPTTSVPSVPLYSWFNRCSSPQKGYKIQLQIHLCCCCCRCHIYIISFATHSGHFGTPLPLSDPRLMFSAGGKLLHAFINKNYARLLICSVIGVVVVLFPCWPLSTHEYSSLNIWGPINRCILAAGCCRQSQDQGATAAGSFIN